MAGMVLVMKLLDLFQEEIMRKYNFSFFGRKHILIDHLGCDLYI